MYAGNRRDLTNQTFGRWQVLSFSHTDKSLNYRSFWNCRCTCGTERKVAGNSLVTGASQSCGCLKRQKAADTLRGNRNTRLPSGEANFNELLSRYKRGARSRKLEFSLSREEFRRITKEACFYCGREPFAEINRENSNGRYIYTGIDRIDNQVGYTIENCVPCCRQCNEWKMTDTQQNFLSHVERIYKCRIMP